MRDVKTARAETRDSRPEIARDAERVRAVLARRGDVLEYIVLLIILDLMYRLADAFEILRGHKTQGGGKPMRAGWRVGDD